MIYILSAVHESAAILYYCLKLKMEKVKHYVKLSALNNFNTTNIQPSSMPTHLWLEACLRQTIKFIYHTLIIAWIFNLEMGYITQLLRHAQTHPHPRYSIWSGQFCPSPLFPECNCWFDVPSKYVNINFNVHNIIQQFTLQPMALSKRARSNIFHYHLIDLQWKIHSSFCFNIACSIMICYFHRLVGKATVYNFNHIIIIHWTSLFFQGHLLISRNWKGIWLSLLLKIDSKKFQFL